MTVCHKIRAALRRGGLFFSLLFSAFHPAAASAPADTILNKLEAVEIVERQAPVRTTAPGVVGFGSAAYNTLGRVLGEADIAARLKLEPGIASQSDYGSGVMIDGADPSQTIYRIAGAPVFFPYRFGGAFSTFNMSHFAGASLERSIHGSDMPSRLGAKLDLSPYRRLQHTCGLVNVGLLGSSATIRVAASKTVDVIASMRASYIDEVYGRLLHGNATQIRYRFMDFNITANYRPDPGNTISVNAMLSHDRLGYDDNHYDFDMKLRWRNSAMSAEWLHRGNVGMTHRIFYSGFSNRMGLMIPGFRVKLPTSISAAGLSGEIDIPLASDRVSVASGYELEIYSTPAVNRADVIYDDSRSIYSHTHLIHPVGTRIFADADIRLSSSLKLKAGISAEYFHNGQYGIATADPRIALTYTAALETVALHGGAYHQYLHQLGFSELGLASDFWLCASDKLPAQCARGLSAEWTHRFSSMPGVKSVVSAYWRRVKSQPEYDGMILDLANADYEATDHTVLADGHNYGVSLSLRKETGRIVGSAGIGYGCARRRLHDSRAWVRGRSNPGLTATVSADWRISDRWNLGAAFRFATGRPCTPVKAIYVVADNLLCEYGTRNSANLPAYHRLDISATYGVTKGAFRHMVNISVLNAYGHNNVEAQAFKINPLTGQYGIKRLYSLYRFIPSVSYTIEFL